MEDEQTEITAEATERAQPERPEWLPSNFSKPEDLAKSYTHATQKITEQGQELAVLRSQIEEIQASQNQYQAQEYSSDLEQRIYDAYESGDGRSIASTNAFLIQQAQEGLRRELLAKIQELSQPQNTELVVDYAKRSVSSKYQDWQEIEPEVARVIEGNPVLRQMVGENADAQSIAGALETAYKIAKFESGQTAQAGAAQKLDELNRLTKEQAQTLSGGSVASEQASEWDRIMAARSGVPPIRL